MAVRLNPLSIVALSNYAYGLMYRNRIAEADRALEKLASLAPGEAEHVPSFRSSLSGNWANLALGILKSLQSTPDYDELRWVLDAIGQTVRTFAE